MTDALIQLALFSAKTVILFLFIVLLLVAFFALLAKGKDKMKGRLVIKNLNKSFEETKEMLLAETLTKKEFKKFLKEQKTLEKKKQKTETHQKNIYVLNFHGDIKASAVSALREEVTAIINVATAHDEVVVRIDSAGGLVHSYGLATAQLQRFRAQQIPLTISIDKIAASGGYLMACVGNKILSAPFAIIGSIGVIVQLPNFHRLLKEKHIDFEQETAGEYKRTLTLFGENTNEGREKVKHEIEKIHQLFKNLITEYRTQIDIQKVATGETWLGQQALALNLVDAIQTSDDYLYEKSKTANIYELSYEIKKAFLSKFAGSAANLRDKILLNNLFS